MYTLFWEKGAGSIAIQVILEEMRISYVRKYVDMGAGEHRQKEYLEENPTGLVPALKLPDRQTIGESAAIVLHLGEIVSDTNLIPSLEDSQRPEFLYWLLFMATTGYTTFGRFAHPERYTTDQDSLEPVRQAAQYDVEQFFQVLNNVVRGAPFFLKSGYSALDIYLTMLAGWHPDKYALFNRLPKIAALCNATEDRSTYQKVIADHE
jgi:glutathione S-transferase